MERAPLGQRIASYVVDVVPAMLIGSLALIVPIVGAIIAGFLLAAYWLFKDVAGASLGKMLVGLRVYKRDGSRSGVGQRVVRNMTLALGPSLLIIPFIGYVIAPPVTIIMFLLEIAFAEKTGFRIGDRMAGTGVFKAPTGTVQTVA